MIERFITVLVLPLAAVTLGCKNDSATPTTAAAATSPATVGAEGEARKAQAAADALFNAIASGDKDHPSSKK